MRTEIQIKTKKQIRAIVAKKLISYRKTNKIGQEEMADNLGIKRPAYAKYEEQVVTPHVGLMQIMAKQLGLNSVDELIA